jgi:hypothetical protein
MHTLGSILWPAVHAVFQDVFVVQVLLDKLAVAQATLEGLLVTMSPDVGF